MSTEANTEKIDVKKLLGNPKITFVLGKSHDRRTRFVDTAYLFSLAARWTRLW